MSSVLEFFSTPGLGANITAKLYAADGTHEADFDAIDEPKPVEQDDGVYHATESDATGLHRLTVYEYGQAVLNRYYYLKDDDSIHLSYLTADVTRINGDDSAVTAWKAILDATIGGTVNDVGPGVDGFKTSLQPSSATFYDGGFLVFTDGAQIGQGRLLDGCTLDGGYLVVAFQDDDLTAAPANGDAFRIIGRSV